MRFFIAALTFACVSFLAVNAEAQRFCHSGAEAAPAPLSTPNTLWQTLASRLELRQNTNVKKDIAQPAFVAFTNPADGPTTYQIGVGVLGNICPGTGFDLDGLLDYQRNTTVDDEQDSFKLGVNGYRRFGDVVADGNAVLLSGRTNFRNDGVKESRSWQTAVGYTHLFSGKHAWPVPNLPFPIGSASGERTALLEMIYFPYAGLEFDSVFGAPTEEAKGTVTRAVLQLNVAFYPAPLKEKSPVEILFGYTYRGDLKDTTDQIDNSHPLFNFEVNYYLFQDAKLGEVGFGVSYVNGEDPDEGFESQAYWQLTLKFRLKKSQAP